MLTSPPIFIVFLFIYNYFNGDYTAIPVPKRDPEVIWQFFRDECTPRQCHCIQRLLRFLYEIHCNVSETRMHGDNLSKVFKRERGKIKTSFHLIVGIISFNFFSFPKAIIDFSLTIKKLLFFRCSQ